MAEEQRMVAEEATATESSTPESGAQPSQESSVAAGKAKLQGFSEQAASGDGWKSPEESGKPQRAPEESTGGESKAAKATQKKEDEPPQAAPIDADDLAWAQKVGLDPKAPDFHAKLIKSYREAQREMSKAKEAEQKAKKTQEVLEAARKAEKPVGQQEELTPLKQFEQVYEWRKQEAARLAGAESFEQLKQVNPAAYQYLKENYAIWRQEAYEQEQEYKTEKQKRDQEALDQQRQFQEDLRSAQTATERNLSEVRKEYPELDSHFKESGVNDFLEYLDKTATWPREFTLSNTAVTKFLAKAARGIHLMDHMEEKKAEWQQEYEKSLKKAKSAELPSGNSAAGDAPPKAGMGRGYGSPGHGVSLFD